jgi:hypothetical protein
MKRTLSLLFCVLLVSFAFGQTATPPAAGDGSEGNPYQIASLENLYWLQISGFPGYSIQTADIDASPTSTWFSDGSGGYYGWPAGTCSGNYDGQGFIIDGLYVNRSSTNYTSLFGHATGPVTVGSRNTITDVHLTNMDITGSQDVGGIVGLSTKYDINNCSAQGAVEGITYVGGIGGRVIGEFGTTIYLDGNISLATVSAYQYSGCLIGALVKSQITNCYAKGNMVGLMNSGNGGLVGDITETTMLCCYSAGPVSNGGGLIGSSDSGEEGSSTVMFCYWDYETSGQASSAEGDMKSTVQMTTQSTYVSWDFTDTWSIDGTTNDGYPYLQANSPEDALPVTLTEFEANMINGGVQLS